MSKTFTDLSQLTKAILHVVSLATVIGALCGCRSARPSKWRELDDEDYARFVAMNKPLTSFMGVELYPEGAIDWGENRSFGVVHVRGVGGCTRYRTVSRDVMLDHPICGMTNATLTSERDDFNSIDVLDVGKSCGVSVMRPFDLESERRWVLSASQEIRDRVNIELHLEKETPTCVYAYGKSIAADGKSGVLGVYVSSSACTVWCDESGETQKEATSRRVAVYPLARRKSVAVEKTPTSDERGVPRDGSKDDGKTLPDDIEVDVDI